MMLTPGLAVFLYTYDDTLVLLWRKLVFFLVQSGGWAQKSLRRLVSWVDIYLEIPIVAHLHIFQHNIQTIFACFLFSLLLVLLFSLRACLSKELDINGTDH